MTRKGPGSKPKSVLHHAVLNTYPRQLAQDDLERTREFGGHFLAGGFRESRLRCLPGLVAIIAVGSKGRLRNDNAKVIEAVAAGESFLVTRNGEPVAELRPIRRARRSFVPRAEVVKLAMQAPHIDGVAFRHDLDRAIDQGL